MSRFRACSKPNVQTSDDNFREYEMHDNKNTSNKQCAIANMQYAIENMTHAICN